MLRLTLRQGSVYYLQHRSLSSPEPHYFLVLNRRPLDDAFLVLAMASSKIESVRRRCATLPIATVVEVPMGVYGGFSMPSIVDCNHVFRVTRIELLQKLQARLAEEKSPLPESLLAAIRNGVLASPLIAEEIRVCLR
jgi:hypothetical protein